MNTAIDAARVMKGEQQDIEQRRSRVARTAWTLAVIAALIYVAFILSGVLSS